MPVCSPNAAAGSTTSASCVDSDRNVSIEMIRRAPARPASGEIGVGAVVDRVGAEQHQQVDLAVGGGAQRGERVVVRGGRSEAELERTDHVAAAQRRQHRAPGTASSVAVTADSAVSSETARLLRPATTTTSPAAS